MLIRTRELVRTICTNMHKQCQDTHAYLNTSVIILSSHNKHPQSILWDKWSLSYPKIFQVQQSQFEAQRKKKKHQKTSSLANDHSFCSIKRNRTYSFLTQGSFILQIFRSYFNVNPPCMSMVSLPRDRLTQAVNSFSSLNQISTSTPNILKNKQTKKKSRSFL